MGRSDSCCAECPYFVGKGVNTIQCEGTISTTTRHLFTSYSEMTNYLNHRCKSDWKRCKHAQALNLKYENPVSVYAGSVRGDISDMLDNVAGLVEKRI